MTLTDFIQDTVWRYRTQPLTHATRNTGQAIRYGIGRRIGRHVGDSIWTRDWDVLIIFDGCRTDIWDAVAPEYRLPTGRTHVSNASCSIDWIRRNLNQHPDRLPATGYVTANPFADHDTPTAQSADLGDTPLGHFRPLYKTEWTDLRDGQIATVPPERVTEHAIDAWRRRDDIGIDHLIVHYMQPHEPYITRPEWASGDSRLLENLVDADATAGSSIWPAVEAGDIDIHEFREVYRDNLRWVLDDVDARLLENLEGRVAITADHGNALGEYGEWHHPPGALSPAVRRVPWATVEATDSRTVTPRVAGRDGASTDGDRDVDDQLDALGYR